MGGFSQRQLGSSQVSDWAGAGPLTIPSRKMLPTPIVIASAVSTQIGSATGTIAAPSTVAAGDRILVLAGITNPVSGTPTTPTSSGLTFSAIIQVAGIGLFMATSPDATTRAVSIGNSGAVSGVQLVLRGVLNGAASSGNGDYTATTSPTVAAAAGTGSYLSVIGICHASWPSTPSFTAPSGWTKYDMINTGWNGISLAVKAFGTGDAVWGATPSYAGKYAICSIS